MRELTKPEVRAIANKYYWDKYYKVLMISLLCAVVLMAFIVVSMYAVDILPNKDNELTPDWVALVIMTPLLSWMIFICFPLGINQSIYIEKYIIKWIESGKELPDSNEDVFKD